MVTFYPSGASSTGPRVNLSADTTEPLLTALGFVVTEGPDGEFYPDCRRIFPDTLLSATSRLAGSIPAELVDPAEQLAHLAAFAKGRRVDVCYA